MPVASWARCLLSFSAQGSCRLGRSVQSMASTKTKEAFKNLKLLDLRGEEARKAHIPLGPEGLAHGKLENGLTYYVRKNAKPQSRAALALGVSVGSVVEEENERGVAHIVEHLAFNATKRYSNHQLIQFLESIGAEFGACSNAYTSADETVYELLVPIDKPGLLSTALSVLADFSTEVRLADEDLEKERGAVLEEWRERRNAAGRIQEAQWQAVMKGSQYADRQPIGLEKIIRTVPASTVRQFYRRWYRPELMSVVAVGDFEDPEAVVKLIKEHFGPRSQLPREGEEEGPEAPPVPVFAFVPHRDPQYCVFTESEATTSGVVLTCKMPSRQMVMVDDYRSFIASDMFHMALTQRLYKISRRPDPPFYMSSSGNDDLVRTVSAVSLQASCPERGTLAALEAMLTEVVRVRLHGFSQREIGIVKKLNMADMESMYLERDQMQSTAIRDEYMQHFLKGEPVPGVEYEARLAKTLIPEITAEEVTRFVDRFALSESCIIKVIEHRQHVTEAELRAVVTKVEAMEAAGDIAPWDEEKIPEDIVEKAPVAGALKSTVEYPKLQATEVVMENGMRVCYKCTDFLDDQVLITGYAYGGLSEVSEEEFHSCSMGTTIAGEMGVFGHKPQVLMDILAGKRAEVGMKVGTYMRTFSGDCSPTDLETALQLIYQLFTTSVQPVEEELRLIMKLTRESIEAQERDPFTSFTNRVREINYGNAYYFRPITVSDLDKVEPKRACTFFDLCFKDPAAFTVAIVGNLNPDEALPLILQYLGGIPRPHTALPHYMRDELRAVPFKFPEGVIRENVMKDMVEPQSSTQITFPVELSSETVLDDVHWTKFLCKLLETKIMQELRFKHGQVYTVSVSAFLGGSRPSSGGSIKGDIAVSFSCNPEASSRLVQLALDEIQRLQEEGPSEEDVSTVIELEQRAYETGLQENSFWLDQVLRAYHSRSYTGDLDASSIAQRERRESVIRSMTKASMQDALVRILPMPCHVNHTAVCLLPRPPLWKRLLSLPPKREQYLTFESKVLLATAGAAVGTGMLLRYLRSG